MGRSRVLGMVAGVILIVAGCTGAATASPPPEAASPSPSSSTVVAGGGSSTDAPSPSESASPTASASELPSGSIASVDPCALYPVEEAKKLTGVAFAPGKSTHLGLIPACEYRSGSVGGPADSLTLAVLVAANLTDAQAAYQAATIQADAAAQGIPLVKVAGLGDEAVRLSKSTAVLSINAIYVRRGSTFFGLDDETTGKTASDAAMKAAAEQILGELP